MRILQLIYSVGIWYYWDAICRVSVSRNLDRSCKIHAVSEHEPELGLGMSPDKGMSVLASVLCLWIEFSRLLILVFLPGLVSLPDYEGANTIVPARTSLKTLALQTVARR